MLLLGLLARFLALFREMLIANNFGVSAQLDALYLGLSLPIAIVAGAGGGLSRAAVAVASGLDRRRFGRLLSVGTARLVALLLPLSLLMAASAPFWVNLMRLGEGAPPWGVAALAAALGSLTLLGGCLAGFFSGLANALGRHNEASLNPVAYNLVVCLSIMLLQPYFGIYSIAVGLLAAEWLQLLVLLPGLAPLWSRVSPRTPRGDWKAMEALFLPSAIIGTSMGLNVAVDRIFATGLETGSIAALSYAERLVNVPAGLIGTALALPLFTRLSRHYREGRVAAYRDTLLLGVRLVLLAGLPLGVLVASLAGPIIGILLQRGEFTAEAAALSRTAMAGYALGVPFQAMTLLLTSTGLLGKRAWTTVWVMVACIGINAVLDAWFVEIAGLFGLAMATTVVSIIRVALMLQLTCPRWWSDRGLATSLMVSVLTAIVLGAALLVASTVIGTLVDDSLMGRCVLLAGSLLCAMPLMLLLWRPLIQPEWKSLRRLRKRVAASA